MKRKVLLYILLLIAGISYAQNTGITYQAVIYKPGGEELPGANNMLSPLVNTNICLRFNFLDFDSGTEYQEVIKITTDSFGMVNLVIGNNTQTDGYANGFNDITWDITDKYLKVELDVKGNCSNFEEISNQLFNYVPFALFAAEAQNLVGVAQIANGGTGGTTINEAKTNLQLENVDNTSDLNKPVSNLTQTALNLKENTDNKSTSVILDGASDSKYPTVKSVKNYVDANTSIGSFALAEEVTRATNAEQILSTQLNTEISRAIAAETTKENLVNKSSSIAADALSDIKYPTVKSVKTYVDSNMSFGANALSEEIDRAKAAENLIATNLANEESTRVIRDASIITDLNNEIIRAKAAEDTKENIVNKSTSIVADGTSNGKYPTVRSVKEYVDASANSLNFDLSTEISRATTAEGVNTDAILTEKGRAQTAEGTLTINLTSEASTRAAADVVLTDDLADEETRAINAEGVLRTDLANETTRATNAEGILRTDLATEVTNRTNADLLKEDLSNKSVSVTTDGASDTKYPSVKAVKTFVDDTTSIINTNVTALSTLADGKVYVGDVNNQVQEVAVSGDATMSNSGVLTIGALKVTTGKVADLAITTDKIADVAVTTAKIADANVTTTKIADLNVITAKIANDAVTTDKIANDNVTTAKIANLNVTTAKIADANVTNDKLDKVNIPLSGFGAALADVSLGSQKLINVADPTLAQDAATKNYVDTNVTATNNDVTALSTLADGKVYVGDVNNQVQEVAVSGDATMSNSGVLTIGADAVTTAKILNANVTTAKISDLAVTTAKIADANVTTTKIADLNVITAKIADLAVTTGKLADANVTTDKIANLNVTTAKIADANVTNDKLDKANIPLSGFKAATSDVSLGSQKLTEVADPTLAQDAATKNYVDTNVTATNNNVTALSTLADGKVYVGDGTNQATEVLLSGDATMTNTGVVTIGSSAVTTGKIADANVTTAKIADGNVTNAKLAATSVTNDKLDKTGIPLSGFGAAAAAVSLGSQKLTNVADPTLAQDAATKNYVDNNVTATNNNVTALSTLADGKIYVGDGTNQVTEVAVSGDATMSNSGVLTIEADAITTAKILNANITTAKIADDAVTTAKILNANVTNAKIADDAITTAKILNANVTTAKIADANVTTVKIADANVTTAKIANDAVTTVKILDANVTTPKIADGNVTNAKLQNSSLTINGTAVSLGGTTTITASPVGTALTSTNILVGSAANVAASVAMTGDVTIGNTGVTAIGTSKVTTANIANDAITTVKILNANVTDAKLDKANIPLSGFKAAAADVALGGFKLTGVANPTLAQDAATKAYVDAAAVSATDALALITAETSRATAAETTIASNLTTEKSNRIIADNTLTANLQTEVDRAIAAENTKEDLINKSTNITTDAASDTKYPSVKAVKTYVDTKISAGIATNVSGIVAIANGGTGSATQNFVDLTTDQTVAGAKTFSANMIVNGIKVGTGSSADNTNTALGSATLSSNIGTKNTAIGSSSLASNVVGDENTAVGYQALINNTTGDGNTASGIYSLKLNINGDFNTASGYGSLQNNTDGGYNTASGMSSLQSNTSGYANTAVGYQALKYNTTGNSNAAYGYSSGSTITTGKNNTFIGTNANATAGNFNQVNSTAIGYGATVATDNTVQLGNNFITNVITAGKITAGTITYPNTDGAAGKVLMTNGSGTLSWGTAAATVTEVADESTAMASQTSFTLSQTPSTNSKVKMYVNGVRLSNTAYTVNLTTKVVTYNPTSNGGFAFVGTERIQFDYYTENYIAPTP